MKTIYAKDCPKCEAIETILITEDVLTLSPEQGVITTIGKCSICGHQPGLGDFYDYKPDYKGFGLQLEDYEKRGIPTDMKLLIQLAKKYHTEIPKFENGELYFKKESYERLIG